MQAGGGKKTIVINRRAPHGSLCAWESLDFALTAAAFEHQVSLAFLDDGVYQLKAGQDTEGLGVKDFARAFGALDDFEIKNVYVEKASMNSRGLTPEDLMIPVQVVDSATLGKLIESNDIILSF